MSPRLFAPLAILVVLLVGWSAWPQIHSYLVDNNLGTAQTTDGYGQATVGFSDVSVVAQVPTTAELQAQGLAGRTHLSDREGMLWLYDQAGFPTFWMKGMVMSIDIIWLDQGQVVDVTPNMPFPTSTNADLPIYRPRVPASGVLEVAAGFAATHGIKTGDPAAIDTK